MGTVKKPKKTALTETTEEYAASSTIHGIGYIFDRELNIEITFFGCSLFSLSPLLLQL